MSNKFSQSTTFKKSPRGIAYNHPEKSLFRLLIYFNYNHPDTGVQVIKAIYSNDLIEERNQFTNRPKPNHRSFQCFNYLARFVNKLIDQNQFWSAVLLDNQLTFMDSDGFCKQVQYELWHKPPGTPKLFTTPPVAMDPIHARPLATITAAKPASQMTAEERTAEYWRKVNELKANDNAMANINNRASR